MGAKTGARLIGSQLDSRCGLLGGRALLDTLLFSAETRLTLDKNKGSAGFATRIACTFSSSPTPTQRAASCKLQHCNSSHTTIDSERLHLSFFFSGFPLLTILISPDHNQNGAGTIVILPNLLD